VSRTETANEEGKLSWRRGVVDILVDMLEVASKETGKTDIVYRTNLNFRVVRKYLDFLLQKGLIQVDGAPQTRKSYRTTEKGRQFIRLYRETIQLIS